MTDARIPAKWLSIPKFAELPDHVFGFMARALSHAAEAETNGLVKRRYLANLHADGEQHPDVYAALAEAGIWAPTADGYQFIDWELSAYNGGLGQSLAETVRALKDRKAAQEKRRRAREKAEREGREVEPENALRSDVGGMRGRPTGVACVGEREREERPISSEALETDLADVTALPLAPEPDLEPQREVWGAVNYREPEPDQWDTGTDGTRTRYPSAMDELPADSWDR